MPEYLANTGYTNPSDPTDGVFQYTKSSKGTLFDYNKAHPQESQKFNHVMGGVMAHQASWLDIYPHETLLGSKPRNTLSNESAILVDVGGNIGRDLERFRLRHPDVMTGYLFNRRYGWLDEQAGSFIQTAGSRGSASRTSTM